MSEAEKTISEEFLKIEYRQAYRLLTEVYYDENVQYIYNPLDYARETHGYFVRKYLNNCPKVLFLGINPGPWGMAQHGVPFGDITVVTEWLKIKGNVYKPHREHPARPILGLQSRRSEVSGKRFWSLMQDLCGEPEVFFDQCFVHNYCPLSYLATNAKNITPLHLKGGATKRALHEICDQAFRETVALLKPSLIVGIGNYSRDRALAALRVDPRFSEVKVVVITHPSPANPVANKGWMSLALRELEEAGVLGFLKWSVSESLRHSVDEEAHRLQQEAAKTRQEKQKNSASKQAAAQSAFGALASAPVEMGYFMSMLRSNQELSAAVANDFGNGSTGLPLRHFANPESLGHSALDFSGGPGDSQPTNLCKRNLSEESDIKPLLDGTSNKSLQVPPPAAMPQGMEQLLSKLSSYQDLIDQPLYSDPSLSSHHRPGWANASRFTPYPTAHPAHTYQGSGVAPTSTGYWPYAKPGVPTPNVKLADQPGFIEMLGYFNHT